MGHSRVELIDLGAGELDHVRGHDGGFVGGEVLGERGYSGIRGHPYREGHVHQIVIVPQGRGFVLGKHAGGGVHKRHDQCGGGLVGVVRVKNIHNLDGSVHGSHESDTRHSGEVVKDVIAGGRRFQGNQRRQGRVSDARDVGGGDIQGTGICHGDEIGFIPRILLDNIGVGKSHHQCGIALRVRDIGHLVCKRETLGIPVHLGLAFLENDKRIVVVKEIVNGHGRPGVRTAHDGFVRRLDVAELEKEGTVEHHNVTGVTKDAEDSLLATIDISKGATELEPKRLVLVKEVDERLGDGKGDGGGIPDTGGDQLGGGRVDVDLVKNGLGGEGGGEFGDGSDREDVLDALCNGVHGGVVNGHIVLIHGDIRLQ